MLNPSNLSERSGSRGHRLAAEFVAGLIGNVAGAVVGLVVGAVIGGNLYGPGGGGMSAGTNAAEATDSGEAFAGMYGYEATGWVGLIVGVIVGGSAGVYWAGRFGSRTSSYRATLLTSVLAVLMGAGMLLLRGRWRQWRLALQQTSTDTTDVVSDDAAWGHAWGRIDASAEGGADDHWIRPISWQVIQVEGEGYCI